MARKSRGKYVGFKKVAKKTGSKKLAAYIGRKKYGKKGMAKLSAQGRKKGASHSTAARRRRAGRVRRG